MINVQNMKILAILAAAIVVVAGASAVVLLNNDDDDKGYYSSNSDCRLQVLGNADKNDYLDDNDVTKIKEMISSNTYDQMADANNDGKVDETDLDLVQKMIDLKKSNSGKADSEKESMTVKYITVNNDIRDAVYPVKKLIVVNTQRVLDICMGVGISDRVVATNDYANQYATNIDSQYMYKAFASLPSVGDRKTPDLESIAKSDADAIYAGSEKYYLTNVDSGATSYAGKTILRLASWENGGYANGALMIAFFTDADEGAEKFVRWMDSVESKVGSELSKVSDKSSTSFLNVSSATYFGAQADGVATTLTKIGATNIGNTIILDTSKVGGSVPTYAEDILEHKDMDLIIYTPYMYLNYSDEQVKEKYNTFYSSLSTGKISALDAVKNQDIVMINYELPFCLVYAIAAKILFPDIDVDVDGMIKEYIDDYTDVEGYTYNPNHFYYIPGSA